MAILDKKEWKSQWNSVNLVKTATPRKTRNENLAKPDKKPTKFNENWSILENRIKNQVRTHYQSNKSQEDLIQGSLFCTARTRSNLVK